MLDKPIKEVRIGGSCEAKRSFDIYEIWIGFECGVQWEMVSPDKILERVNQWQQASQLPASDAKAFMGELEFDWPEDFRGFDSKCYDLDVYYHDKDGVKREVELIT